MRKKIIYVLFAFIATLAGNKVLQHKKKEATNRQLANYFGTWFFTDDMQKKHTLTITNAYDFSLDQQSLETMLVEATPEKLIVRDQYGFYLIVSSKEMTFYDESADTTYLLYK
ncbi:hypothetical protein A5844_002333 [Enterococcus sp. 10A9_DIV0425]|uniref:DUF4828 domain-containing protein n=1 Tax=Candidatus Enterococcus wittei TaxID=1987383 RepID=A0A242JW54_9ENTE|nr:DUF4828 domain-containing protein [Enterococcus sp. 10A9_DIV0425]OTP09554.1 hypothetical protein A5844_002333 [Enterococcus sp. 10A9_DIV0425]THE15676.1 DUF4828 domain-containing protein [Enterococcus hirae]